MMTRGGDGPAPAGWHNARVSDVTPGAGPTWVAPWSLDQGTDRVRALFADSFEGEPEHIVSSPGRVTVIGDHTDYSGGLALSTVLPHRTYVAVRRREDQALRVVSAEGGEHEGPGARWEGALSALDPGTVSGWPAYAAGAVWALLERGYPGTGLDIAVTSCVTAGGGLGSSAALTTAVARACDAAWGLALDTADGAVELAEAGWDAERRFVGIPCGRLDPHTVLRCPEGRALLLDFADAPPTVSDLPLTFADYGLRLLVIDTRHRRGDRWEAFGRRAAHAEAIQELLPATGLRTVAEQPDLDPVLESIEDPRMRARARHVVTEIRRVLDVTTELTGVAPAHERFLDIGAVLLASHRSLRSDYEASTPAVDTAVDTAFASGALGARLVGVGFGGTAIALVRSGDAERIAARVEAVLVRAGHPRPRFLLI